MTTQPIKRTLSLLSALAVFLTVFAVPASAIAPSEAKATAALDVEDRLVLAGEGRAVGENPFDVVVNNTGSSGLGVLGGGAPSINWIMVLVPTWHTAFADTVAVNGGTGTWETTIDHANGAIITQGGSLAPGQSLTLSYGGTITDQLTDDDGAPVYVQVSEHGSTGPTAVAKPASDGALNVAIDVLDIPTVAATGPVGTQPLADGSTFAFDATDGTVTAGQDNVALGVDVINLSTEAKTVGLDALTGVTYDAASVTPAQLDAKGGAVNAGTIAVDGVTFGDPGTTEVDATVSDSDGMSDRIGAGAPLLATIERAPVFTAGEAITPKVFGVGEQTFTVDLKKNGIPATLVDVDLTFESVLPGLTAPSATVTDVLVERAGQNVRLAVPVEWDTLLGHDDGDFNAKALITGIDDNGATVTAGPIDLGLVTFDSLQPFIRDLKLTAPDARVKEGQVATNGSTLSFTGTAIDPSTLNSDARCGNCAVTLELVGLDPKGAEKVYETVTTTSGADGALNGSFAADSFEDRRDFTVKLEATVTDAAGNTSKAPTPSNSVVVDTLRPAVFALGTEGTKPGESWDDGKAGDKDYRGAAEGARVRALAGGETPKGEPGDPRIIDVVFDEPIAGGTTPLQWFVDSNGRTISVESAEIIENRKVRLTLREAFGSNARGVVNYDPTLGLSSHRIHDRAGLTLNRGLADTIDNIVPLPVDIALIDKLGLYDAGNGAKFFTNVSTYKTAEDGSQVKERNNWIDFTFAKVAGGSTVNIEVLDGSAKRTVQYSNSSTSDQSNVLVPVDLWKVFGGTPDEPNLSDRELTLNVFVTDSGPKQSTVTTYALVLDRADPTSAGFTIDYVMNHVVANANEALRFGVNAGGDWLVGYVRNGKPENLPVNEVNNGERHQRRLAVDPNAYPLKRYEVTDAKYVARNEPERRYRDAAGNRMAAGTVFTNGG